jgi:hypothetical protein
MLNGRAADARRQPSSRWHPLSEEQGAGGGGGRTRRHAILAANARDMAAAEQKN